MSQNQGIPINIETDPNVTTCSNCRAPMPLGLRFCRNCGFRLGEGSAEYTETARFQNGGPAILAGNNASPSHQAYATTYGLSSGPMVAGAGGAVAKRKKKMSGMTWMFLGLLVFFLAAAAFTALVAPIRRGVPPGISVPAAPRAYVGVSSFEDGDGGVTFDSVEPPDGPADKAGLVGGDIITNFDGTVVKTEDEITDLLRQTPIGKTVDVIYIRDGETKTTKLTPVSKEDFDRLIRAFRNRPLGSGRFGFDDDDTERVPIAGTKIFGVRLDDISPNYPADMAGIKKGDVVIEFDGVPIRTPQELTSRVKRAVPYTTVKIVLMRGAERLEVPVKMGRQ